LIEIRGQIARKLKFWGQLEAKLKKFAAKDQSAKAPKLRGLIDKKNGGEIEEIESLMVN
jgi:hypothetical protein